MPASGVGTSAIAASAQLSELAPNTIYHYRVTASNAEDQNDPAHGGDQTFTTFASSDSASTNDPTMPATARDGALSAEASGGTGSVTVGHYGSDIGGPPLPGSSGNYVDVYLGAGANFTKVEITNCEVATGTKAFWYDPASGWQEVSSQSYPAPGRLRASRP